MWFLFPVRLHWRKVTFYQQVGTSCREILGWTFEPMFLLSTGTPPAFNLRRPRVCQRLCEFAWASVLLLSRRHCHLGVNPPSDLCSLSASSTTGLQPEHQKRVLRKTSHLVLSVPKVLTFCTLSSCDSYHLLQEESFLLVTE